MHEFLSKNTSKNDKNNVYVYVEHYCYENFEYENNDYYNNGKYIPMHLNPKSVLFHLNHAIAISYNSMQ